MENSFSAWSRLTVTEIGLAMYVAPGRGSAIHENRPFHGLILNNPDDVKDYHFSDGTVLRTNGGDLFYLPKGSTYRVVSHKISGCYAINFDAEITDQPFTMHFRNNDALLKAFKTAAREWRLQTEFCYPNVMKSIYDIVCLIHQERQKQYTPDSMLVLLEPALNKIAADFTQNGLSVAELASLCNISEAYFRRIFLNKFGISPKEYLIRLRINYARQLLQSGHFSVAQTAEQCGYFEPSHFSREFTRHVGMSPNQYRRQF